MCNTTFFWTLGTYLIQRDGEGEAEFDLKTSLNKIFSLPLMGFIIGLIIVILHIQLPTFLTSDLQYLGSLTTPLSMIFIGLSVSNAGVKQLVLKKDQVLILLGRFVVSPGFDGCNRLLVLLTNFDEASFYHPVGYACHDQCTCGC